MNESHDTGQAGVLPGPAAPVRYTRVYGRLLMALLWTLFGALAILCVSPARILAPEWTRLLRLRMARTWVRGVPRIIGTRIVVKGRVPQTPFYLVGNHVCWIDFFVTQTIMDAVVVSDKLVGSLPVLGTIMRALGIIEIGRSRDEVLAVNQKIEAAMRDGQNIVMAPEATVSLGRAVYPFHSPLLEPAVRLERPVYYASLTVRTPEGYPPASHCVVLPDPEHPLPDAVADADRRTWGAHQGFLGYATALLGLPWHEFTVHFGDEPIAGTNRKALARELQAAVEDIFVPVK